MAQAPEIKQPWSFDPTISWKRLDADEFNEALKMWEGVGPGHLPDDVNIFVADLPFYSKHKLYCVLGTVDNELRHCFMLHGDKTELLNGKSHSIHEVNKAEPIEITYKNAACYIRFFCSFVHGEDGPFLPLERTDQITLPPNLNEKDAAHAHYCMVILQASAAPIAIDETYDEAIEKDAAVYGMLVSYSNAVFLCQMCVHKNGLVEMLSDNPLLPEVPVGVVIKPPHLFAMGDLIVRPLDPKYLHPNGVKIRTPQASTLTTPKPQSATNPYNFPSDREITRAYIEVLVRHALQNSKHWDYVSEFNKTVSAKDDLLEFIEYLLSFGPVVLVESELPFIEELVADLVSMRADELLATNVRTKRIDLSSSESDIVDLQSLLMLNPNDFSSGIVGALNIDRIAFALSKSKNPVLIGTDNPINLKDALCNVVELELKIPRLSPQVFEHVFKKIWGGNLPRNWKKNSVQWVSYLNPHDFHQPCKMGLTGSKAYQYLHKRVKERLNKIDAQDSPSLADLHGMAEAKQMAEDLITDIQAALKKQIPWSAVDRGMLLSGPPGTGKTTLAKAIAKACGVRFIAVSAATWQSAGAMVEHLRAIRASFVEARRYAPSILFIDEVDSFSDREKHVGHNATYNTEIVNALLAEIQGFDTQKPVFVIGATNFPEKVDPALRRAGRLDKLVYIPRPNVEALKSIFEYYLGKTELVGKITQEIDTKFLAGLSFGLTGADVETRVRGAARRARKAQQPINQQFLIDEITGKSRNQQTANRLSPEDMHRVAVHESGHAIMQILTNSEKIAYVSIVPRDDGSLGFVSNMPSGQYVRTRKQYLDDMQTVLAGRAAEEIVFGKDNISSGAGGIAINSDLAVATAIASNLVCNMGMSKTSSLIWGKTPTDAQLDEIEKLLQEAYNFALTKLEANRKPLDVLTEALVEKQELMGHEVVEIIKLN